MEESVKEQLTKKLMSVTGRRLRAFLLAEKLNLFEKEEITDYLEHIVSLALGSSHEALSVMFSFVDILEKVFEIEIAHDFYNKIQLLNTRDRILHLIINPPPPHKFLKKGEVHTTDIMMDYLPLGVKRSFAKKMDRILLRRMLLEKDPYVIKHLLSNPMITEKELLKIASVRPTNAEVIRVIYLFDKWINLYAVKEAIVKNPYSPFRLALLMLFYMQKKELVSIIEDNTLHPTIRDIAKEIMEKRKPDYSPHFNYDF